MAFGVAAHGINGLIYVSGAELEGANGWTVSIDTEQAEYRKMGDSWVTRVAGLNSWNMTLAVVHDQDAKKVQDAVTARTTVATLVYPNRADLTTYYNGSGIYGFGSSADGTSIVSQTASIAGSAALTMTGFAP